MKSYKDRCLEIIQRKEKMIKLPTSRNSLFGKVRNAQGVIKYIPRD